AGLAGLPAPVLADAVAGAARALVRVEGEEAGMDLPLALGAAAGAAPDLREAHLAADGRQERGAAAGDPVRRFDPLGEPLARAGRDRDAVDDEVHGARAA